MFFKTPKPHQYTFSERLGALKQFGFAVSESGGKATVTRKGCGAMLEDAGEGKVKVGKAGVMIGDEIAMLINGGYEMFLRTPSGKERPALATQLKELHAFDEDLREGLGQISLYNLSLGTTSDDHLYDRVQDRDSRHQPRPWEKNIASH